MADIFKDFETLKQQIEQRQWKPLYCFCGEEPYFRTELINLLIKNVVDDTFAEFNKDVVYGDEVTAKQLLSLLRTPPMMGNFRLVLLKEAQRFKQWDAMVPLLEKPLSSVIFVIDYVGKLDKRKKWVKAIQKNGVLFESPTLYDYHTAALIQYFAKHYGLSLDEAAIDLMAQRLGPQPKVIQAEMEKLKLFLGEKTKEVQVEVLYDFLGFHRKYNVFALLNALGERNFDKVMEIVQHLDEHPLKTSYHLFHYLLRLLLIKSQGCKSAKEVVQVLGLRSTYIAKQYLQASQHYLKEELERGLEALHQLDRYLKGIKFSVMEGKQWLMWTLYQIVVR